MLLAEALSGLGGVDVVYQHGLALSKAAIDDGRAEAAVLAATCAGQPDRPDGPG